MTTAINILEKFPEFYTKIAARRDTDPILDEICRDFEDLIAIADTSKDNTGDNQSSLHKEIRATIQDLGDELRKRLRNS